MFYKSIASSQITIPTESVADLAFGPGPAQHSSQFRLFRAPWVFTIAFCSEKKNWSEPLCGSRLITMRCYVPVLCLGVETANKTLQGNRKRASQDIEIMTLVCKGRMARLKSFPRVLVLSAHKKNLPRALKVVCCLLIQYGMGHTEEKHGL